MGVIFLVRAHAALLQPIQLAISLPLVEVISISLPLVE